MPVYLISLPVAKKYLQSALPALKSSSLATRKLSRGPDIEQKIYYFTSNF